MKTLEDQVEDLRQQVLALQSALAVKDRVLNSVKEACLFVSDDGETCITTDPVIDTPLFEQLLQALALTSERGETSMQVGANAMKRLKAGEQKKFKGEWGLEVVAECVDEDTPYVHITVRGQTIVLEDIVAQELLRLIPKALSVLPSSK